MHNNNYLGENNSTISYRVIAMDSRNNLGCVLNSYLLQTPPKMTTLIFIGSATPSIAVSSKPLELQIFQDAENVQDNHVKNFI